MRSSIVFLLAASLPLIAEAQGLMSEVAGVYKHRFMSATISPGKAPMEADEPYQAEDVIEIVPFDREHVYFRIHLDFYNGHSCSLSGMAKQESGGFIYREPVRLLPELPRCVLRLGVDKGQLAITDRVVDGTSSCSDHCGARGSLNYTIGMDKRRPIRYMARLKASRHYQAAIDEMRAGKP